MILRSGDIEVDEALFELRVAGRRAVVQPRVFDLLRCLMRHAPRVVTRTDLRLEVWHGAHVCRAAAARAISVLRRVLGHDESSQELIRTVRGRGYRFTGPVDVAGLPPRRGRVALVFEGEGEMLDRVVAYASMHGVDVRNLPGAADVSCSDPLLK
jgi:DNA-binding winged helix-turn-helix (wHTH) protein